MLPLMFLDRPSDAQVQDILALYRGEGWWFEDAVPERDPPLIRRIVLGSHCFAAVLDGDRIIGMGRAISDRVSDAYIQDVVVRGDRRGQGLGHRIVAALRDRLRADGLTWIGLIAERDTSEFYFRLGFRTMAGATPLLFDP